MGQNRGELKLATTAAEIAESELVERLGSSVLVNVGRQARGYLALGAGLQSATVMSQGQTAVQLMATVLRHPEWAQAVVEGSGLRRSLPEAELEELMQRFVAGFAVASVSPMHAGEMYEG